MKKALDYFGNGYNCAESVIKATNEKKNTEIPVEIASSMGHGMAVGSVCGAICAGVSSIGVLKGGQDAEQKKEARLYTKELMNKIEQEYGSVICRELKGNKVSCKELIDYVDKYIDSIE
ncbi:C-GCAxxG-C-C family (seleno)protein [Tepidibacter sp. Z1-5]|uniref:C-GCAxxG-C-C family (seleno)protein n=1 Tax=Tepidibacter sp. Z1-5 TaxID=3134138 RepID=UPI0030C53ED1